MPDITEYYKSLWKELFSTYNRVRNLVNHHWEDWRYKEIIIKKMIQKFLPGWYNIGTWFVATRVADRLNGYGVSTQIDLIIYKEWYPVLFQEDDFVIVIPDAVRWIIEVKSNIKNQMNCFQKCDALWRAITQNRTEWWKIFNGIVGLEWFATVGTINKQIIDGKIWTVNHVVLNNKYFIRNVDNWIKYYDIEDLTIGFFIRNLITMVLAIDGKDISQEQALWFPIDKELHEILIN